MNVELLINGHDRTSLVDADSIFKSNIINDREDSLNFDVIESFPSEFLLQENGYSLLQENGDGIILEATLLDGTSLAVGNDIELWLSAEKVFGGIITSLKTTTRGDRNVIWHVECSDYTFLLNRALITERYEDSTADVIIADLITQLNEVADETFTGNNVNAPIDISSIGFNRLTVRQCIDKIAQLLNYYWYIDYDKDIHFFAKNSEVAPFSITDDNGNFLYDSLEVTEDLNQIRNVVLLEGAEIEGTTRVEIYNAVENQRAFPLANKYAHVPTVYLNGSSVTVGIDFLTADEDMSVAWDFNQKYLRFIDTLNSTQSVMTSGIPLFPLIVQLQDSTSISLYGEYQYTKKDTTVRTRDEAIALASAQLDAYAAPMVEGSFKTYTDGLRAGQIINIQSDVRSVDDFYLIERVNMKIQAVDRAIYEVQFASVRTQGIVSVLQGLLTDDELKEGESGQILAFEQVSTNFSVTAEVTDITVDGDPYVWGTDKWNMSVWS